MTVEQVVAKLKGVLVERLDGLAPRFNTLEEQVAHLMGRGETLDTIFRNLNIPLWRDDGENRCGDRPTVSTVSIHAYDRIAQTPPHTLLIVHVQRCGPYLATEKAFMPAVEGLGGSRTNDYAYLTYTEAVDAGFRLLDKEHTAYQQRMKALGLA